MVIETQVRVSGTWRTVTEVFAKVGGSWKDVDEIHSRVSGVWEQVFKREKVTLTTGLYSFQNPNDAKAGVQFLTDGRKQSVEGFGSTPYVDRDVSTDWVIPNNTFTGTYHIRGTLNSGPPPNTGTLNVWEALTSNRRWENVETGDSITSSNITIEISADGGSTTLESTSFNIKADGTS